MAAFNFTHVCMLVTNFKECYQFYRDVLGFTPTIGNEDEVFADFDTGAMPLALFSKQKMSEALATTALPPQLRTQDPLCLVFTVPDVDRACDQLRQQGVILAEQPTDHPDWIARTAHFRDPDGNLIEIQQPISPQ